MLRFKAFLLLLVVCILFSCTTEKNYIISDSGQSYGPLDTVINSAGGFMTVDPEYDTTLLSSELSFQDSSWYICERKKVNITEAPEEFPIFDPISEVIFPGNLLQGEYMNESPPRPIPLQRSDGTIVMTLVNGASSVSRHVDEVCLSSVMDAQNQIIEENPGHLPARFHISIEEVQSEQQLAFSMRAHFNSSFAKVKSALSFSTDKEYSRFMVKLNQSFYTMAYEMPDNTDLIFAPSVSADDLERYVYPGNPAAYVSSVTYGRMFYLLIESTESKQEMEASLTASFSGVFASGGGSTDVKFVNELENVQIKAFALGGEQEAMFNAISTDFDTMRDFLAKGGKIETGVPISYVVRSCADPSRIINMNLTTEYEVVNCTTEDDAISNKIFWYNGEMANPASYGRMSVWEDAFGFGRDAIPDSCDYAGFWQVDPTTESTQPGIKFVEQTIEVGWRDYAQRQYLVDGQMKIDGPSLVGTDYTIFAVVKPLAPSVSGGIVGISPNYFLTGVGDGEYDNLSVGFYGEQLIFGHDNTHRMTIDLTFNPIYRLHVYVFRFSQVDGMAIYVDGNPEPVAIDSTLTHPLDMYPSPKIGSSASFPVFQTHPLISIDFCMGYGGGGMIIMDFKAYGTAISDIQRMNETNRLLTKHSL